MRSSTPWAIRATSPPTVFYASCRSIQADVEHRRLHDAINRLTACAVEITHDGKTYFGPLIQSGAKDELTSHYAIQLNRDLIRLYGETHWSGA